MVGANDDSGVCAFTLESNVANIPVTGGTTYYIEWDDRWSSTGFDWDLSYVSCTPPTATGSSTDNCGAGTFTVDVDVTSLGSSVELQIESDLNGIEVASVLATGIVSIPTAYTAGTPVTITLRSTSDANCSLVVGTFGDCCSGSCVGAVPASSEPTRTWQLIAALVPAMHSPPALLTPAGGLGHLHRTVWPS